MGDLVIFCDKNMKRTISPFVRVIETFTGDDDVLIARRTLTTRTLMVVDGSSFSLW